MRDPRSSGEWTERETLIRDNCVEIKVMSRRMSPKGKLERSARAVQHCSKMCGIRSWSPAVGLFQGECKSYVFSNLFIAQLGDVGLTNLPQGLLISG
jgi:hypothetical protein